MIAGYNTRGQPVKVLNLHYCFADPNAEIVLNPFLLTQNLMEVFSRSITISGFIVYRLFSKFLAQFSAEMPARVASGEIKYREHVYDGLANSGEAILAVQKGQNTAKAVIHVADE
jgi:NADPH-dependent curcumin reductase CurA